MVGSIICQSCWVVHVADDLKLVLSDPDLFSTLLSVMERFESNSADDQMTLVNLTADLIVLLLTGG